MLTKGNPVAGIGKSLFVYYFMWHLARRGEQTVVWERKDAGDDRVMFSGGQAFAGSMDCFKSELEEATTW